MSFRNFLYKPIDISWLIFLRLFFGGIMIWEASRYLQRDWIYRYFINPVFHFKYYGFSWVHPWPGDGMVWHFWALGFLAALIFIGAFYRIATILFFVAFSYIFLIDQATYLNHFYLVMIISALMCVLPAHHYCSVDAWLRPKLRSKTVPNWTQFAARFQLEIILLFSGFVKINYDWLHLQPLTMWFESRTHLPYFGAVATEPVFVAIASYGTIILHCVGAPLLFFRSTRLPVFIIYCIFHLTNATIFHIGIFPWITIVLTLVFFEPDWPKILWQKFLSLLARLKPHLDYRSTNEQFQTELFKPPRWQHTLLLSFFVGWFSFQIFFPLRHYLYPSHVSWNEEGHRFAWRMKLRSKNGKAIFTVTDPVSGEQWQVKNRSLLTRRQSRKVKCRPDMILQFAHYAGKVFGEKLNIASPIVTADVMCSLNGRRPARLIDPNRNLMTVARNLKHADWILPLNEPLFPGSTW